eukprot:CAMPEP_0202459822 /NCGR_PEP_ID=MMETSP1360-20130828/39158_1 /ASSEMBLY_ACC=CAM_ASM_000848 /TAXON_ID=515479 /ORGANISM="Licmophora paradoxa, Strain CCMP2313" /LENGTH=36 /DNA_ID= /DNA_START= /DNA_END= /DNA_ORIENTATION=
MSEHAQCGGSGTGVLTVSPKVPVFLFNQFDMVVGRR